MTKKINFINKNYEKEQISLYDENFIKSNNVEFDDLLHVQTNEGKKVAILKNKQDSSLSVGTLYAQKSTNKAYTISNGNSRFIRWLWL